MKKALALFLALVMLLSLFPVSALAEGNKGEGQTQEETQADLGDPAEDPPAGGNDPADDTPDGPGEEPGEPGDTPNTPGEPGNTPSSPDEPGNEPSQEGNGSPEENEPGENDNAPDQEGENGAEQNEDVPAPIPPAQGEWQQVQTEGGADNAALLDRYARNLLESARPSQISLKQAARNVGDWLDEPEKTVYDLLRAYILDLATGEETKAVGLVFELGRTTFTPADLGMEQFEADAFDKAIAQEPLASVAVTEVVDALLADCPYELYWYDKTVGYGYRLNFGDSSYSSETNTLCLVVKLEINFAIAQEFAQDEENVNNSASTAANAAVARAQSIVRDYAGNSEYARLIAYKNEICTLTDYNGPAAENDDTPYGNPWQLIWVFDGDKNTTVVCEGYAKAFQYLCDLSNFTGITCSCVTGYMYDSTGGGRHMWNVVTMDDGRNYLADVTNCDSGSVGYPDKLFLKGYSELADDDHVDGFCDYHYAFDCGGGDVVNYRFDADQATLYGAVLTLSDEDYSASAPQAVASGTCGANGNNLSWTLDENGLLTISGTGEMDTFHENGSPWARDERIKTLVIEPGVTSIGWQAFSNCGNLTSVSMPSSVTYIEASFMNCSGLKSAGPAGGGYDYEFGWTKAISAGAFNGCGVESVTIPNTVTSIGDYAFCACRSLESVTIPVGVTSIGASVFSNCTSLESITIPNGVTSIGRLAFQGCTGLNSLTIPASVTSIDNVAFALCTGITAFTVAAGNSAFCVRDGALYTADMTRLVACPAGKTGVFAVPDSVTDISGAFGGCSGLTAVTISDNVTSIGDYAFAHCTGLTTVKIPAGVESIGEYAFMNCSALTSVTLPADVTSIGAYAFFECEELADVYYGGTEQDWADVELADGNDALEEVTIHFEANGPAPVITLTARFLNRRTNAPIRDDAAVVFASVDGAGKLDAAPEIDGYRYSHETIGSAYGARIKERTTNAGDTYYYLVDYTGQATQLTENTVVTYYYYVPVAQTALPVAYYQDEAGNELLPSQTLSFDANGELWFVEILGENESYKLLAPAIDDYKIEEIRVTDGQGFTTIVTPTWGLWLDGWNDYYGEWGANWGGPVTSNGWEAVGAKGALVCTYVYTPTIVASGTCGANGDNLSWTLDSQGLLTISGTGAMADFLNSWDPWYNKGVTTAVIENGVTNIGAGAFAYCADLTSVSIPASVTSIGDDAFSNCGSLTSVSIPASVTSIGRSAFIFCSSLESINVAENNQSYWSIDGVLYSADGKELCCVPGARAGAFEIPSGVTSIGERAFQTCSKLTEVTIPSSVSSIGAWAFGYCSALTDITIPAAVQSIGEATFANCSALESVTIPNSVKSIGDNAFFGCEALSDVYYVGSSDEWTALAANIGGGNGALTGAELHYIANFTVTVSNDGHGTGSALPASGIAGTEVTLTAMPAAGYHLKEWQVVSGGVTVVDNKFTIGTNNVEVKAVFELVKYSVAFDPNGGAGAMNPIACTYGKTYTLSSNSFTRRGYSFAKWNTEPDGSGTSYTNAQKISNLSTEDGAVVTLYAQWTPYKYTVAFNANNGTGSTASMKNLVSGVEYELTANAYKRTGWTFTGWNTKANGSGEAFADGAKVKDLPTANNATVTLYAQWQKNGYTVVFDPNGGTGEEMARLEKLYTQSFTLPKNTYTRALYTFSGWSLTPDGAKKYSNAQEVSNLTAEDKATVTLYAVWTPYTYQISFNANSGSGSMSAMKGCKTDVDYTLTANKFTRTGYAFTGWNTAKDGSGTPYADAQVVRNLAAANNATVTLYAQWAPISYDVVFDPNGGDAGEMEPQRMTYDVAAALKPNAYTRTGYSFSSWNTKADGKGTKYLDMATVKNLAKTADGITLYAQWTPIKYQVAFALSAEDATGTMKNQTITYDVSTALTASTFKRAGYYLAGWDSEDGPFYADKAKVKNLTAEADRVIQLTAHWEPISYQIVFNANGGKGFMPSAFLSYDAHYELPESDFTREGYEFVGWGAGSSAKTWKDPGETVNNLANSSGKTVTFYAIWQAKGNYSVQFDPNAEAAAGTTKNQLNLACGKSYTLTANGYKRAGWTFTGWNTEPDGSGDGYANKAKIMNLFELYGNEVTLYAQWTPIDYTISYKKVTPSEIAGFTASYTVEDNVVLEEPIRVGYDFDGWYTTSGFKAGTKLEEIEPGRTGNLTLYANYAKWAEDGAQTYTIYYEPGDADATGTMKDQANLAYGKVYTLNNNGYKLAGYNFAGWDGDNGEFYANKAKVDNLGDVTLTARWTPVSYKLTYKNVSEYDYPEMLTETSYNTEDGLVPGDPERAGCEFLGWYTTSNFRDGTEIVDLTGLTGNKTLYARWSGTAAKYTVAFDGNGATSGKMSQLKNKVCGTGFALTANAFKRSGYDFLGWALTPDADEPEYLNKAKVANLTDENGAVVTLYAVWTPHLYKLTYKNVDNAALAELAATYGYDAEEAFVLDEPVRGGCRFDGWYTTSNFRAGTELAEIAPGTMKDMTLYAKWSMVAVPAV